jgi:two-component system, chemotaxis family, chemotaxis protein CheY
MPQKRILIIDDNPSIRSLLRSLIESDGQFAVCGDAEDGVKGIEKAKQVSPDLILLDLAMPNMNGAEAAPILKRILPRVPIILFTMHQDSVGKALAAAVRVDRVIAKPDGMSRLLECIRDLLGLTTPIGIQASK